MGTRSGRGRGLAKRLSAEAAAPRSGLRLTDGSRIAVIGGGPAGSLFSCFTLTMARDVGLALHVDLYEGRDLAQCGPTGCNHCGGVVSESLVQLLAAEGINLPSRIVQRGIDSYALHMDVGSVRIATPLQEKRIAALFRGGGPRGLLEPKAGLDRFLQETAVEKGANLVSRRVSAIEWTAERPRMRTQDGLSDEYDLVAVATGVNSSTAKLVEGLRLDYDPPRTTKTYICEFLLGQDYIREHFGTSMHVFLSGIPRLEFAALIPKGECLSLCILGERIDKQLVSSFLNSPEVRGHLPPGMHEAPCSDCHCGPRINVGGAPRPFADRLVLIGDCGVSRLYKDGIGAAYRTAKAAARTAVFDGISAADFSRHFGNACRALESDNRIGKMVFGFTDALKKTAVARRGILRMLEHEQRVDGRRRRMSGVIWDLFTGSAPYRDILMRTLHPFFWGPLAWHVIRSIPANDRKEPVHGELQVSPDGIGRLYGDGELIVRQGDSGDCMYVVQEGEVEVVREQDGTSIRVAILGAGDFFGEMALFDLERRSASVLALGEARVLTVDKRTFLRRVQEDPSLAFRIVRGMSGRIRKLNSELAKHKTAN